MHRSFRFRLLALLAVAGMALAACGDDASTGSGDTTSTTEDAGSRGGGESGSNGGSDDGAMAAAMFTSGECQDVVNDFLGVMQSYGQAFSGTATAETFTEAGELLEGYASVAPSEIRDSFEILASELGKFFDAFAEIEYTPGEIPDEETQAKLAELGEIVDSDALEAASDDIQQWLETNCA